MSLRQDRREAQAAEIRAIVKKRELQRAGSPLARLWRRHRTALVIGGGMAAGVIVSLLPIRAFARAGSTVGTLAGMALRSPLAPIVIGWIAKAQEQAVPAETSDEPARPVDG
ncbi:MAG: hypothetical protein DI564_04670 [Rhodanobacter denitrificans]|uniref:Uncharacterized protein n=1 Tax=Rhodanobacter denitrificans TaxID=666685 RepID=A0A2W5MXZ3_9GAMM|nr:MAG: hypothetical protein DI564_04670 [Rhodanobacter denitrificans]